jgi:hypothetical protein
MIIVCCFLHAPAELAFLATSFADFLLGLLFDSEDGDDIFL